MKPTGRIVALVVGARRVRACCRVFLKSYGVYLCTLFCVTLMATYGLNLTVGYAGQMSLGQAAFYGIGAYIAAIALKAGVPFFVVLPLAASRASRSGSRWVFRRCASSTTTSRSRRSVYA